MKRVLLVDDDEALLRTLTDYLVSEGFEVVPARDGQGALSRIDEKVPDILILDISMPVMGGIEVLKRIQTPDGELRCPTLVLTARSAMQGFFRGIAVDGFLAKPCSQQELIRIIRQILSAKEVEARSSKRTKRKLLVGDHDPQRTLQLQNAFTEAGYELVVVRTGPEVLERSLQELPDAILMSETLPHMNGSVVASLVRTMPSTHLIPVVLYDETRGVGDTKCGWKVPKGVTTLFGPTDPLRLLESVEKALSL
jgi:CheY-like chemotaxis protein